MAMPVVGRMEAVRYFKRAIGTDSGFGPGTAWFEFDGDLPVRQVERYGDRWFDSRTEYHDELGPGLTDQTPSGLGLGAEDVINRAEFEAAWSAAVGTG